jgi:hypothetical protein
MRLHHFVATLLSAGALGVSSQAWADSLYDWSHYIGGSGLDLIQAVSEQSKNPALSVPALSYVSYLLEGADYIDETANRAITSNESWGQAAVEQGAIDGSGFLVSKSLNGLLASCFATASCVLSSAGGLTTLGTAAAIIGVGVDADLVSKDVEAGVDLYHDNQQLAATLTQIQQLQRRVDQQNALKQQLQVQRSAVQWQTQRNTPSPQTPPATPKAEVSSAGPAIHVPTQSTIKNSAATPVSLPNPSSTPSLLTEIGVGPAKLINTFGGPVLIGELAVVGPIGATPAKVGTPVDIAEPTTIGSLAQQSAPAPYIYALTPKSITLAQTAATASGQVAAVNATEAQTLKIQADGLKPPPLPAPPVYVAPSPPPVVQFVKPGGISLSLAAAMRMRLDLDLDGMYFDDGNIILTGNRRDTQIDAALLLTALRASCEPGDPYFSLDADDGAAWIAEGKNFSTEFLDRIRYSLHLGTFDRNVRKGLALQTISARRDYPQIWAELAPNYPDFKSRLVFRPDWLRQTRFGEILYHADVLLKELASGAPVLDSSRGLRASTVEHYASSDARSVAKGLISAVNDAPLPAAHWSTSRLWFDFVPQPPPSGFIATVDPSHANLPSPTTRAAAELYRALSQRGLLRTIPISELPLALASDGKATDLSAVYPKMFVRLTDLANRRDVAGRDPNLDQLSQDVNRRINLYVDAYPELRALVSVFRAYVIAVKIAESDPGACGQIRSIPLLSAEKAAQPLPTFRQSEIFFTIGKYTYAVDRRTLQQTSTAESNQGGISLSGKNFNALAMHTDAPTPITQQLTRRVSESAALPSWTGSTGRQYVTLSIDSGELLAAASSVSATQSSSPLEVSRMQSDLVRTIADQRRREAEKAAMEDFQSELRRWQQLKATIERQEVAWRVAEDRYEHAARRAKAEELVASYGPPINAYEAADALPFALMLHRQVPSEQDLLASNGWIHLAEWEDVFRRFGYSGHQIDLVERSGFRASVYGNERVGGVSVAYRWGDNPISLGQGHMQTLAVRDIQLKAAADLAWLVRHATGSAADVTLTAEGPANYLVRYAAEQSGISKVLIFGGSQSALNQPSGSRWMRIGWMQR